MKYIYLAIGIISKGIFAEHVKNSFRKFVLALITWYGVKR